MGITLDGFGVSKADERRGQCANVPFAIGRRRTLVVFTPRYPRSISRISIFGFKLLDLQSDSALNKIPFLRNKKNRVLQLI